MFQDFDVVGERFGNIQCVEQVNQDTVEIFGFSGTREGENRWGDGRSTIQNRVEPAMVDGRASRRGSL